MHDRSEWISHGASKPYMNGRKYMYEFRRLCKTCGEPFPIFVTERIANGAADSNSFALVNCEVHRRGKNNLRKLPWEA